MGAFADFSRFSEPVKAGVLKTFPRHFRSARYASVLFEENRCKSLKLFWLKKKTDDPMREDRRRASL